MNTSTEFKVWKIIQIGTGLKTANDFRKRINEAGMDIGRRADEILDHPAFQSDTERNEVELVVTSVVELGFDFVPAWEDISKRARELGLGLCPIEVGLQLRIQYADQPFNEQLIVAMEPVTYDEYRPCYPNLLVVGRGEYCKEIGESDNGQPWLDAKNVAELFYRSPAYIRRVHLVFVRPRK